ncbi:helix-turn-helix domain-containing protein [Alteromonas facilis]|uniref:helix-turn-helix domain-containing protein n=1 Tax=Alteromonas facilis TaxID=2048004 RepID=UPI000C28D339|nr:helix-turn-helix domain-containing protein [Alteromonas facilis]
MYQTLLGLVYFIACSHALMLCASLWQRSAATSPGRILALIAAVIGYKLYEGGALYTGLYVYLSHSMDLLPGEVLWIGPLLWFYANTLAGNPMRNRSVMALHFIPAIALWLYNTPSVLVGSDAKIAMWKTISEQAGPSTLPLVFVALFLSIKIHLSIYLFLAWRKVNLFVTAASNLRSDNSQYVVQSFKWLVVAFLGLEVIWVSLFVAQQFWGVGTLSMVSDVWLLFVATMVISIGYIGLQRPDLVFSQEEQKIAQHYQVQAPNTQAATDNVKYFHSALPDTAAEMMAKEVEQLINQKQLYLNDSLSLTDLAKASGIKAHTLSQVINQTMKTNFYKLINTFRVQHAIELIDDDKLNWTLERIAFESGFSNRVTFSKAFKEIMGSTPSAYKKQQAAVG